MRAFVVRPFKIQQGVDFDRVQRELIDPAFSEIGVGGSTTEEILAAGNIREDMFALLLSADLVVVDITLHNANVFYELGIRHARRRRGTFLLRGTLADGKDVAFNIRTDRYLAYDPVRPGDARATLVDGLRATLAGERDDSPIYSLLAGRDGEPPRELGPPRAFAEDVKLAQAQQDAGLLALLAEEAQHFSWAKEAQRQAGRALVALTAYESALEVWSRVLESEPQDFEANKNLGNIYHRFGRLPESNQALQRIVDDAAATGSQRAEALGQQGRNMKEEWRAQWMDLPELAARREEALRSPGLMEALDHYRRAFDEDLNQYYPGINALALQVIANELAAGAAPAGAERAQAQLAAVTRAAVQAALGRGARSGTPDPWAPIAAADLELLTSDDPAAVSTAYRTALYRGTSFDREAVLRQLELYKALGLRSKVLDAALRAIGTASRAIVERPARVLLFTGHRLDAPGREVPRFPASMEQAARERIRAHVQEELEKAKGTVVGIAGAASGGDILFHEACRDLGIQSLIYLALPRAPYAAQSVQDAGPGWVERFDALLAGRPHRVLCPTGALPGWLQSHKGYGVWQRSNRWMLQSALASGGGRLTLIALWDGKVQGDGPGGTADLVRSARAHGARELIIRVDQL